MVMNLLEVKMVMVDKPWVISLPVAAAVFMEMEKNCIIMEFKAGLAYPLKMVVQEAMEE